MQRYVRSWEQAGLLNNGIIVAACNRSRCDWARPKRLSLKRLRGHQRGNREHARAICPRLARCPARAARQRGEALEAVFVAALGMDAFAGAERETPAEHPHALRLAADQVHLDPVPLAVVDRAMGERAGVEIAAQFAVDAMEHIEIEARGDSG